MRLVLTIAFMIVSTVVFGQLSDTVKIQLMIGDEVLPGATLRVKGLVPPTETHSDSNGLATIAIPADKEFVEISFMGPYVRLKIERPTDSIFFNINSGRAVFYN